MARFARIDSQIRANRLILADRFKFPELNPFPCESRFGGLTIANRRFEAIRANRFHVLKIGVFLRIDSRESAPIRVANRWAIDLGSSPVLPFLAFSVLPRKNPQINQGFLFPAEPRKSTDNQGNSLLKINQGIPKNQGTEG